VVYIVVPVSGEETSPIGNHSPLACEL
jgi:hypothetical protein